MRNKIKNLVRIITYILFVFYIGAFSIGMGRRGRGEGCASYLFRQIMGVPLDAIPEQNQSMHDRILAYAEFRKNLYIPWVNRDFVTTEDGSTFNPYGLGYYGIDDLWSFRLKLRDTYVPLMQWSDYECSPSAVGMNRPGGRRYGGMDCSELPGGGNPCSPPDVNRPPGIGDCRYHFTGSYCFTYVAYVLLHADQKRFGGISPERTAEVLLQDLIDQNLGEIVDRTETIPGDLIFMDFDHDGTPSEHVAVLSYIASDFQWDKCLGIIGFYEHPFGYKASDASMERHLYALLAEWGPYCYGPPFWWLYPNECVYVHLYE